MPEGSPVTPTLRDGCAVCGASFVRGGRRRYCSAACRQAAWRQRQPQALPVLPRRTAKVLTVYECGTCDTRYLGQQWCDACQRPCRRLGLGGECPHCAEPVALVDLAPDLPPERR